MKPASEAGFTTSVVQLFQLYNWLVTHFRPAQNRRGKWVTALQGDAGFPDIAAVHRRTGRFIIAELKTDTGTLTDGQIQWMTALDLGDTDTFIWRPSDWVSIEAIAKGENDKR